MAEHTPTPEKTKYGAHHHRLGCECALCYPERGFKKPCKAAPTCPQCGALRYSRNGVGYECGSRWHGRGITHSEKCAMRSLLQSANAKVAALTKVAEAARELFHWQTKEGKWTIRTDATYLVALNKVAESLAALAALDAEKG